MRNMNMKIERGNIEGGKVEAGRLGGKREWGRVNQVKGFMKKII